MAGAFASLCCASSQGKEIKSLRRGWDGSEEGCQGAEASNVGVREAVEHERYEDKGEEDTRSLLLQSRPES